MSNLDNMTDSNDSEYAQLSGFRRDIMYIIAGLDDPHGLLVKEKLEDYYEKEVHHGRLYPNLDALVDDGLLEKGTKDRRTNEYNLTDKGEDVMESRREWESGHIDLN